jgi:hypothetical protein
MINTQAIFQRIDSKTPGEWKALGKPVWRLVKDVYALTNELVELGHVCGICGHVLSLVSPGKYQCDYCEMEEVLTQEILDILNIANVMAWYIEEEYEGGRSDDELKRALESFSLKWLNWYPEEKNEFD